MKNLFVRISKIFKFRRAQMKLAKSSDSRARKFEAIFSCPRAIKSSNGDWLSHPCSANATSKDGHTTCAQQLIAAVHSYQPAEQIYTPPNK